MLQLSPDLNSADARINLDRLVNSGIAAKQFRTDIKSLQSRFNAYVTACPAPFIAPGLIVTPEIRRQSEIYLPIAEISSVFHRLYRSALSCPPILSSTPFYMSLSWADAFVTLPPRFQQSANPARLLEELLSDRELLLEFLFASFLPQRFYGGFGRYPGQMEFIRQWLTTLHQSHSHPVLSCLDAACGTGEDSYGLAALLMDTGFAPDQIRIEGWTLEPLEVWAAVHLGFPHDRRREAAYRKETALLFEREYQSSIHFRCADLTESPLNYSVIPPPLQGEGWGGDGVDCRLSASFKYGPPPPPNLPLEGGGTKYSRLGRNLPSGQANYVDQFDLILCNGLLGGPIINEPAKLEQVVSNLAGLLAPGGLLLAADSFHGGWKSNLRDTGLKALFVRMGLKDIDVGEGIGGLKSIGPE
ncbi:MAG: hypothetical protein HY888_08960 [Deltaproteobacteria bacterium]|nr:hypothetical protein [Deltaproteobacteria bacterium]